MVIDLSNLPLITNPCYWPLYLCKDRYLVLMGGGGSGKSVYASQKLVFRLLTEPGHRILVVRKVGDTLRDSVFAELVNTISMMGMTDLFKIPSGRSSELYLKCTLNGNEVLFFGLDNVEKRKSISGITSVWIEEASELDIEDYRQLDIRLRTASPHYKQMIITFNPISITHWLKAEFFDIKKPNCTTLRTTYKDNKFLVPEAIQVLENFRFTDPYFYMVYCLGEWGVIGKTVFNAEIVTKRLSELRNVKPVKRGYFEYDYVNQEIVDSSIRWIEAEDGYVTVFEEPIWGHPYSAGGDTAGEGSDMFVLNMIENISGKQVAVLHHEHDEDLYARQCYCLGKYYNYAMLGIESNYSTFPNKELIRFGYQKLYNREIQDTYTGKLQKSYGFRTDKLSRPMAIAKLVQIVREHPELFNFVPMLEEMLTFVRNEKGRAEAQEGKHDDLVMAAAITYVVREQQSYYVETVSPVKKKKLAEILGINKKTRKNR